MKKLMTNAEYLSINGDRCPCCGSDDVLGEDMDYEEGRYFQQMYCQDCGAVWYDRYVLDGYQDLIQPAATTTQQEN